MQPSGPPDRHLFSDRTFLFLLVAVSAAFAWIVWPFFGAILWATILAILFRPLYRRLVRSVGRARTPAALATLLVVLVIVILPTALVSAILLQESARTYNAIQSGQLDLAAYFHSALAAMPAWVTSFLERFDMTDVSGLQKRLSDALMKGLQVLAPQALNVGQNALDFVVSVFITLYLLFFFLRDGDALAARITRALPLRQDIQRRLFAEFSNMIRAIVKGTLVVAIVQGMLGGLIFWILGINAAAFWGVVMAFLSLLPAVGTALVWGPVAIYFLVSGAIVKGVALMVYGVLVIGLVDNVLRPVLVGKDTRIPDYVVLISTLGGIAVLGINGLVVGPVIAALFIAIWQLVAASRADAADD
jgi:predicted PurR-regulated permease PerM